LAKRPGGAERLAAGEDLASNLFGRALLEVSHQDDADERRHGVNIALSGFIVQGDPVESCLEGWDAAFLASHGCAASMRDGWRSLRIDVVFR
jgi:hypothetical protein